MTKRTIGSFEILEQLGVGGMGIVYQARYKKTGQLVALKVLSPNLSADKKLLARFDRETQILKRLKHPNIVQYYGGGVHGGQRYYAMELMEGGSLEDLVKKRGGKLSWEQTIDVGKQICAALEHAHQHGIIHRDLKPGNLFLSRKGRIKLGDFGIARDTEATALTAAGKTVGTYAYMAPEQIVGRPPVSGKTDLYALGCVMYELLTGHPPFEADTPAQMLFAHIEHVPPDLRSEAIDCPIWLVKIIERLLEKDPADRHYDALAVQAELNDVAEKISKQESVTAHTAAHGATATLAEREELARVLGKKKKKKKKKQPFYEQVWFLAACLLLVVGVIVWAAWPLSEDEIYQRVQAAMQSDNLADRVDAQHDYIEPYLEDSPEGQYASQMASWNEEIETDVLAGQVNLRISLNKEPRNEAERLYMAAREIAALGDRATALTKYYEMVRVLGDDPESRHYVKLAQREIDEIEAEGTAGGSVTEFVNAQLRKAEQFRKQGKTIEARKIWRFIDDNYSSNQEVSQQVAYARARWNNEEPPPLDLSPAEEP